MALEIKKEKIRISHTAAQATEEKNIDFDIVLPDYCGDVKKILKCTVTPGITNTSVNAGAVTVSGTVGARLIYINEKDKIDCCETTANFSVDIKDKDIPGDVCLSISTKINYTNCRAVSQRRISVSANVSISLTAFTHIDTEILTDVSGKGMECKSRTVEFQQLICRREKIFELGETASLGDGKGPVGKILRINNYAVIDSKKAVSDKLLIKGEMYTDILYMTDENPASFESFRHSMPISQIIDMPGIDEKSICIAQVSIMNTALNVKQDSSSSNRLIEIAAKLCAIITCTQKGSVDIVEDAYCISHETEEQYKIREFSVPVYTVDRQKTHKASIEIPGASIRRILDIWCCDAVCSMKGKDDRAEGNCSLTLGILYLDDKDYPCYAEKTTEISLPVKLSQSYGFLKCSMSAQVRNIEFKLSAKDKTDLAIEVGILAEIESCTSYRILDSVFKGAKKESSDTAALTLYFAAQGEGLWEIAKKYNTSLSLIMQENDIEGDFLKESCMLMIPSA